jgi:hypothetical protein
MLGVFGAIEDDVLLLVNGVKPVLDGRPVGF